MKPVMWVVHGNTSKETKPFFDEQAAKEYYEKNTNGYWYIEKLYRERDTCNSLKTSL